METLTRGKEQIYRSSPSQEAPEEEDSSWIVCALARVFFFFKEPITAIQALNNVIMKLDHKILYEIGSLCLG